MQNARRLSTIFYRFFTKKAPTAATAPDKNATHNTTTKHCIFRRRFFNGKLNHLKNMQEENEIQAAQRLLNETGISILDAARLIRNALDFTGGSKEENLQYCRDVIECGRRRIGKMSRTITVKFAMEEYMKTKTDLKRDSLRDVKNLGRRIMRAVADDKKISQITSEECRGLLDGAFATPSQFNKGRTMLHGLFTFAVRMRWRDENPVDEIPKQNVEEKEILPLSIEEAQRLLKCAEKKHTECAAALGIMLWAGIRPNEVARLHWEDIDLEERIILVRCRNSKTGGARHVDMCPALVHWLKRARRNGGKICPKNWTRKWQNLRQDAGFAVWTQDVLRHTFASYNLKRFKNLPRLQTQMGHRDTSLIRTRYVNMGGITKSDAKIFFERRGIIDYVPPPPEAETKQAA